MRSLVCLGVMAAVSLSAVTMAQTPGETGAEEVRGKIYRATLFNDWEGPELFVKVRGGKFEPLEIYKMAYTKPLKLEEGNTISFYVENQATSEEMPYLPYFSMPVPQSVSEPMLVLFWDQKASKAGGKIVEFGRDAFPYGSYQFVNLGPEQLGGYLGEKSNRFLCRGRSTKIVTDTPDNGERMGIVLFSKDGGETPVYSTTTIHRSAKRVIFFLSPHTNKLGRTMYRSQTLVDFASQGGGA